MTVPNLTPNRESPEAPSRGFVPVRELVERQGRADPIQDWEAHGPAPHSAALPAPDPAASLPPKAAAPDAVQLSLALDEEARPDWPAVRYFEDRGLHYRHWKAARRVPWLQNQRGEQPGGVRLHGHRPVPLRGAAGGLAASGHVGGR